MRLAILSDTHGLLRPEALHVIQGADHILHAGDVGDDTILDTLTAIAPLTAIRGNIDKTGRCALLPATEAVELAGKLFYLIHSLQDLDIDPLAAKVHMVVTGHSHKPLLEQRGPVTYLNPGSAGPRRFKLPVTLAIAEIENQTLTTNLIHLLE